MIECICGTMGGGKSLTACSRIARHLASGGKVYSNMAVKLDKWESAQRHKRYAGLRWYLRERYGWIYQEGQYEQLPEFGVTNLHEIVTGGGAEFHTLVVLDEALEWFDSEDRSTSERALFSFLRHSRKFGIDVLFLSQVWTQLNKRIRDITSWIYRCTDMQTHRIPVLNLPIPPPWRYHILVQRFDRTGKIEFGRKWEQKDPWLYGCYDTDDVRTTKVTCKVGQFKFDAKGDDAMTRGERLALAASVVMSAGALGFALYPSRAVAGGPSRVAVVGSHGTGTVGVVSGAGPDSFVTAVYGYAELQRGPCVSLRGRSYYVGDLCEYGQVQAVSPDAFWCLTPSGGRCMVSRVEDAVRVAAVDESVPSKKSGSL